MSVQMDGEASPMSGGSQRADKRSYKDLKIDVEEMEEPYLDFEESSNKKLHEVNSGAWLEESLKNVILCYD